MTSPKQQILASLDRLPDEASFDDVLYRVYVLHGIGCGLQAVEEGRTLTSEQLKREVEQWMRERAIIVDPAIPEPVFLDDDLEQRLTAKAAAKDKTLSELVNDLLRGVLDLTDFAIPNP